MADGDMAVVNEWYAKFGGNDLKKVQETIRNGVSHSQFENVSFIVFAHEYAANPGDKKFLCFIYQYFHEKGAYQINLSAEFFKQLSAMLNDPEIKGSMLTGPKTLSSGVVLHPAPDPTTLDPDQLKYRGGFQVGGAANYNLAIKALDFASKKLVGDLTESMKLLLQGPGALGPEKVRELMVAAYKQLVPFWGDSDLTKFGFTQR